MLPHYRPQLCVATDTPELAKGHVHLDTVSGALVATDGSMMCKIDVTDVENDRSGPIPSAALDHARDLAVEHHDPIIELLCQESAVFVIRGGRWAASFDRPEVRDSFGDWKTTLRAVQAQGLGIGTHPAVGFDVKRFNKIAKAFGSRALDITLTVEGEPYYIRVPGRPMCEGFVTKADLHAEENRVTSVSIKIEKKGKGADGQGELFPGTPCVKCSHGPGMHTPECSECECAEFEAPGETIATKGETKSAVDEVDDNSEKSSTPARETKKPAARDAKKPKKAARPTGAFGRGNRKVRRSK